MNEGKTLNHSAYFEDFEYEFAGLYDI